MGILNEARMASQMHLLDDDAFIARMPGRGPTDEERERFVTPNLEEAGVKSDIHLEMVRRDTATRRTTYLIATPRQKPRHPYSVLQNVPHCDSMLPLTTSLRTQAARTHATTRMVAST